MNEYTGVHGVGLDGMNVNQDQSALDLNVDHNTPSHVMQSVQSLQYSDTQYMQYPFAALSQHQQYDYEEPLQSMEYMQHLQSTHTHSSADANAGLVVESLTNNAPFVTVVRASSVKKVTTANNDMDSSSVSMLELEDNEQVSKEDRSLEI